jgi:pyruvate,water dikinase
MTSLPDRWITDTIPNRKYTIWSRGNAGEIYPDPITPLSGSSVFLTAGELGYQDAMVRAGTMDHEEFDPGTPNNIMASFGGYLYLNMSISRLYGVRCPGMTPEMVDQQYYGDLTGIPSYESEARPDDESPRHTEQLGAWIGQFVFSRDDTPELLEHRAEVRRRIDAMGPVEQQTDEQLVQRMHAFDDLYREMFCWHILVSAAVGFGIGTVSGVCQAIGQPSLPMTLISGVGDVDSAAPSHAMWAMARTIDSDAALTAAFDAGVPGVMERVAAMQSPAADTFRTQLADFLERFGSRGPNEWELRSKVWGTHPEVALAAVDRMRGMSDSDSPSTHEQRRAAERIAATEAVRSALAEAPEALAQFDGGLRAAMVFGAARERCKTTLIMVVHEVRKAARELGRRWAAEGLLAHADLVFMLTDHEVQRFRTDAAVLGRVALDREPQYLALWDLEPPFIVVLDPPPLSQFARRDEHVAERVGAGAVLTGIPGCAGVARGRARVILDPSDPLALEPGDILVAPLTDPAWTPLFVPAAAVVVDVGAQITHAVIVSRELGIPCVVSVTDATRRIPDGALIEVDGAAGTVTVLEAP